jgi:hypothetical protein
VALMASTAPPGNGELTLRGWAAEAEAAANIAKALAPTSFVPDHLRVWRNPDAPASQRELDYDRTVQTIAAVLLAGQELEFKPMASLRAFVIIRGTVALFAVAARALLQRHGHEIVVVESSSARARVQGRRAGTDQWMTATWDIERATTAGLYPGKPDSNWRRQTKAMLVARASAEVARWVASDALLALPVMAEEIEESPDGQAAYAIMPPPGATTAAEPPGAAAPATTPAPRKRAARSRAALPAGPPAPAAAEPWAAEPPAAPAARPPARAPDEVPSREQMKLLHAGLRDLKITGREEGLGLVSAWAGRPVESTSDLSRTEMQVVLDRLTSLLAVAADHAADHAPAEPPDSQDAQPEPEPGPGPEPEPPADAEGPPDAEPD